MRRVLGGIVFLALVTGAPAAIGEAAVDRIIVEKSQRQMALMAGNQVVRTYGIALGFAPDGDKREEGDGRTPEGNYVIEGRNASSAYHLSLKISYPNAMDRAAAAERGVSPGGDIFIHGAPNWWFPARPAAGRLDARLHRGDQSRNRGDLATGAGRHAGRDQAVTLFG